MVSLVLIQISSGVPPGSVHGPMVFNMYCTCFPLTTKCILHSYADDTYMYISLFSRKLYNQDRLNHLFFHFLMTLFSSSLVPTIKKTVMGFSTAFYVDIVCGCLSEFKVNPPQMVTAMSALCARAHACVSPPCRSSPPPTVPGPAKRAVLWHGMGPLGQVRVHP